MHFFKQYSRLPTNISSKWQICRIFLRIISLAGRTTVKEEKWDEILIKNILTNLRLKFTFTSVEIQGKISIIRMFFLRICF